MRSHPRICVAALLTCIAACDGGGDDGITDDSTCGLVLSLAGDLNYEKSGSDDVACLSQLQSEGMDFDYLLLSGDVKQVGVAVMTVTRGATGSFPATVTVQHSDERTWTSDACTAAIDEQSFAATVEFGDRYRVHGVLDCPSPATGSGSLTIASFEFVVSVTWTG